MSSTFWHTQPTGKVVPLEAADDPVTAPEGYSWSSCTHNELTNFMEHHYLQDDEMNLIYDKDTLAWLLENVPEWGRICLRDAKNKLVGYITATPSQVACRGEDVRVVVINLLCVHKKSRSRGLAPLLIREATRRAVSRGITQAVYTAVAKLPGMISRATYWHRILNVEAARACGFFTSARPVKNALDVKGRSFMREMGEEDVAHVQRMLYVHGTRFALTLSPTEEYARSLLPRGGVLHSFISEEGDKFVSFYRIGYRYKVSGATLEMAYLMHAIGDGAVRDAVILAKNVGYHVLNSLNIGARDLDANKFVPGISHIHYYMYNWNPGEIASQDLDVILP
jgi:glycylpeptide N-tetradecanoyltransferase